MTNCIEKSIVIISMALWFVVWPGINILVFADRSEYYCGWNDYWNFLRDTYRGRV